MYPNYYPNIFSRGLSFLKTVKWGEFLDGTQKTLGVIHQAIPIAYQVKPMMQNAKTLFKIANVMKEPTSTTELKKEETKASSNQPIFYL